MLRIQIADVEKIEQLEVMRPEPKKDEILLRVATVGICGSDVHVYLGRNPVLKPPKVPGHEFAGEVVSVGNPKSNIRPATMVVVNPVVNCGQCYYCRNSLQHLCERQAVIGGIIDGAMQEEIVVPERNATPLPDSFDITEGPLIEPTAVAIHATVGIRRSNVLVIGVGTIGLLVQQICRLSGSSVISTDISDSPLRLSESLGSDLAVNFRRADKMHAIQSHLKSHKIDCVVDTVCSEETLRFACKVVRKHGEIRMVGIPAGNFVSDVVSILFNEVSLRGFSLYSDSEFARATEYVVNKRIKTQILVSKVFSLGQAKEAFEYKRNNADAIKVVLRNEQ